MKQWVIPLVLLVILVGVGLIAGAYYFGQQAKAPVVPAPSTSPYTVPSTPTPSTSEQTASPTPVQTREPVIVFEAEGSIPAADKSQLETRVVNPLVDYYYKEADQGELLTLTISPNTQPSKTTYPYTGKAILATGANFGFTIEKKNGEISWWFPECLAQCSVSEQYKSKYPEVAKLLGY